MVGRLVIALLLAVVAPRIADAHEDTYPMAAAEYRKRATQRFERYRDRIERHMVAQKFVESKRVVVRERLASLERVLRARIDQLAKDGTITKADAEDVKQRGKQGRAAIYKEFALADDEKPAKPKKPT